MQVTETLSEGLKRELKIVVPAAVLNEKLDAKLNDMRGKVQIKGFRPGKVPVTHLKRVAGRQEMVQIIDATIGESIRQVVADRNERPALNPDVALVEGADIEKIVVGSADLEFTAAYELLPTFELTDWSAIELERPVLAVEDAEIDESLARIAEGSRSFDDKGEGAEAASGDRVAIDFVGTVDGEAFEGGSAEDIDLVLGSGQFIPGFEDQLIGVKVGDKKIIEVTFPEDYQAKHLAGKPAKFDVTVKSVGMPGELVMDDEFAKKVGIESFDKLKEAIRVQLETRNSGASRTKVKRQLLDKLDAIYTFDLPEKLVESEFEQIWKQAVDTLEREGKTFADEETNEEDAKAEYRRIAVRRVRLGLVLSNVGESNKIEVTDQEVSQALVERARQFPGQEREVFDYYKNTPMALATLRAPIFEEKVVDYIVSLANVTDKPVSKDELFAEPEA
ncbi:MAG: trigger factor [Ancalomicrobiaceae bacterium]|nr:trigger factor [Ancalomicrobiaceae bacterium]